MSGQTTNSSSGLNQTMTNYSNLTDQELTNLTQQSNEAAFQALYHRYYEKLYHFVWVRTRSSEISRDLVQELFVRVWRNRESLDDSKSIKAYFYRIANNLVINYVNKKANEKAYLANLPQDKYISSPNDQFEVSEKVQSAIDGLPERPRTVFVLNRFEGFTYADIATSLEISVKTVEKYMSQALRILREQLAPLRKPE